MFRHRIGFVGAWLALAIALVAFPGFESRGLAMGLTIAAWPLLLVSLFVDMGYFSAEIAFLVAFLLGGIVLGLSGWVTDAARLPKRLWLVVRVS